ncbi:hypothetical protein OG563_07280 [Nocardia vinacea]|uniref:Uncharacterized protein n=1 Tax=Nocardia vinacea TaxID=96468 RepID=A0ABZ1Z1V4_9NOCA|nr:hypothetical protein [Nocardia vinacea]
MGSPEQVEGEGAYDDPSLLGLKDLTTAASEVDDFLYLANDAPADFAKAFLDAIEKFDSVRSYLQANGYIPIALSNLESGSAFPTAFNERVADYDGSSLKPGSETLRAAYELIVAAGRKYLEMEGRSAAEFDELGGYLPVREFDRSVLGPYVGPSISQTSYLPAIDEEPPGDLAGYGDLLPMGVAVDEDPWSMFHEDFYLIGEYLKDNNVESRVAETATAWYSAGDAIRLLSDDLSDQLAAIAGDWQGTGAGTLRDVTLPKIAEDLENCAAAAHAFGANCAYVSHWMGETEKAMPDDSQPPMVSYWGLMNTPLSDYGDWIMGDAGAGYHVVYDDAAADEYRRALRDMYKHKLESADRVVPDTPIPQTNLGGNFDGDLSDYDDTTTDDDTYYDPGAGILPDLSTAGGSGLDGADLSGYADSDLADEYAAQQEELAQQQEEYARQQADAAMQQAGMSALQQGAGLATEAARNLAGLADQARNSAGGPEMVPTLPGGLPSALDAARTAGLGAGGLGGGVPRGGGVGGGPDATAPKSAPGTSKLFPRASVAGLAPGANSPAGAAQAMSPMAGSPGPAGASGARGGQQDDKHKRPDYLNSQDNIDEALGAAPDMTRPVVGEAARPENEQPPAAVVTPPGRQQQRSPEAPVPAPTTRRQEQVAPRTVSQ